MADGSATSAEELEGLLENLRALSGEVTTAAVLGKDGEIRASTVSLGVDRERYAAMLSALAGLARRMARENGGSAFAQVRIKGGEEGHVLMISLEGGETLATTTEPDARVGLVLYDMRNARTEIEQRLGSKREEGQ